MSGNRSIHRQNLGSFPIWQITCSPSLRKGGGSGPASSSSTSWRVWMACGDGIVRGYLIEEKTLEMQQDVLDASACNCILTHLLLGEGQEIGETTAGSLDKMSIGCSQVEVARNYVGDDDMAGDLLVISLDLAGKVRIWVMSEDMDQQRESVEEIQSVKAIKEFRVDNATGTCLKICPPKVSGVGDVLIAVPCLDGTIAIVAVGISTPKATKDPTEAGTVVDRWSKSASPIALSGDWHPMKKSIAVGRQDGLVEIVGERFHRLIQHENPVRAVSFSTDGNLLVTASDDGMLCLWDTSRAIPVLVHHVIQAHSSWILSLTSLWDSRRFVSCGADGRIHIWSSGQMDQALHTFTSDNTVWTIHSQAVKPQRQAKPTQIPPRLVSGSENGWMQIYSLEA